MLKLPSIKRDSTDLRFCKDGAQVAQWIEQMPSPPD